MKAAKFTVEGTVYYLVLDGEAMFQIRDTFGGTKLLLEQIEQDTREGFDAACTAAAFMAERGELIRRRLGYAPGKSRTRIRSGSSCRPMKSSTSRTRLSRP